MQSIKRALKRAVASLDDIPSALDETSDPGGQSTLHKKRKGNTTSDSVNQPTNNADKYSQMFEAVLAKANSEPTVDVDAAMTTAKLDSAECTSVCCRHDQLIINMLHCQNQLIDSINNKIDTVMSFLQIHSNYAPSALHHQSKTMPAPATSAPLHPVVQPTQQTINPTRPSTFSSSKCEQHDNISHVRNHRRSNAVSSGIDNNNRTQGNNSYSRFFQHSVVHSAGVPSVPALSSDAHTAMIIHRTLKDVSRRRCNVIVSGLPEENSVDDDQKAFLNICEQWLSVKPNLPNGCCTRIGKQLQSGVPRRLLIHTGSEETANAILKEARLLRHSDDIEVSERIFINPDLAPEAAKLAYEQRQRRRTNRQQHWVTEDHLDSAETNNFLDSVAGILPSGLSPLTSPAVDTSNSRLVYANPTLTSAASTLPLFPSTSEGQSSILVTTAEIHNPPSSYNVNELDEIQPVEVDEDKSADSNS